MNLRAGMIGHSPGWVELLSQAGIPAVPVIPAESSRGAFSVIVAAKPLDEDERRFVREYLRDGGGIFGSSQFLSGLIERMDAPVNLRYVLPEAGCRIRGLSLLDVERIGSIPREANCLRTQENVYAVFAGELLGGLAVVAPFDPGEGMEDFRAAERYFYARHERLPSERVSRVSKSELAHLVTASLEYLHHGRGIPFAALSPFPSGAENVSAFRIDTDKGTPEEIDELYRISSESKFPFSWFLDVGSHMSWLGRFAEMENQEIGLHCFEHRVYLDAAKNGENISRGRSMMQRAGLSPSSFAAPFGFWSPEFGHALDRAEFHFSSEFSWAYDALPHYPVTSSGTYRTLQVPFHPISIGSLLRVGYAPPHMKQYFALMVSAKLNRREPLFFYGHPGHRQWDVVRGLCEDIRNLGARALTLGEYAAWWTARGALRPSFILEGDSVRVSVEGASPGPAGLGVDVLVRRKGGDESLVPLPTGGPDTTLRSSPPFEPPADVARTREFDLRGEIGRQFTRLQRRFP